MICRPCATGADIVTCFRRGEIGYVPPNLQVVETARGFHAECAGCDCQHEVPGPAETAELAANAIRVHEAQLTAGGA